MKTLLKVLVGLLLLLVLCASGVYAWATHRDRVLLSRRIETHHVDFPVPFPLTDSELEAVRRERMATGATGDPLEGVDLDSIARVRAVARGDHLVHSRYGCVECHGQNFGGGVMVDDPMLGRILGPNITAGAGGRTTDFTPSDWDRIVRHGVRHDGLPAAMPSSDFQHMSDQELSDIVSYIRSLPVVNDTVPPVHLGPLGTVLMAVGKLPLAVDEIPDHMAPHAKYPPPADTTVAFGEHLAGVCTGCHGENLSGGPIAGGDPSWPPAMNLTPHPDGLAGWTFEQFATVLRTGKKPDGTEVRPPMAQVVAYGQHMTDVELHALWAYLQSVPPVPSKK
jgi:mono/diheme cytochrome c family protein